MKKNITYFNYTQHIRFLALIYPYDRIFYPQNNSNSFLYNIFLSLSIISFDWLIDWFIFLFIYLSIYLFNYLFIYLSIYYSFISITVEHKASFFTFCLPLTVCVHCKCLCVYSSVCLFFLPEFFPIFVSLSLFVFLFGCYSAAVIIFAKFLYCNWKFWFCNTIFIAINHHLSSFVSFVHPSTRGEIKTMNSSGIIYP